MLYDMWIQLTELTFAFNQQVETGFWWKLENQYSDDIEACDKKWLSGHKTTNNLSV